jgi:hypothetical protein
MRVSNWQIALAAELERTRSLSFAWGSNDCCQFVGRVAMAITGANPLDLFPVYSSEDEARLVIESEGGFAAMLTKAFGEPKHVSRAHKGDAVLCDFGKGPQPAICDGIFSFAPGDLCLPYRRTADALAAWSIE